MKPAVRFKRPEEYEPAPAEVQPPIREVVYRLRPMKASLVQYAVEELVIEDGHVVDRRLVTERDVLSITLSKIEDLLLRNLGR